MSTALINKVKANLREQHYFVNDSWLKECIDYYISENTGANLSKIQTFVISQWLLSDLREINNEKGCMPSDLNGRDITILDGKYIVQVDKMLDIAESKYSQLQKIRKVSEENIKVTVLDTPSWEPKGKRMMKLHLTDGKQDFSAIEYRLMRTLKDTLLPGFKIMIIGPVVCRRGIIMLRDENYKEIGGEVDSLLKANALENILARALGLEENENPYAVEDEENVQTDDIFPDDEFDIDFDEISQIERLSMEVTDSQNDHVSHPEVLHSRTDIVNNRTDQNSRKNYDKRSMTDNHNTNKPSKKSGNVRIEKKSCEEVEITGEQFPVPKNSNNRRNESKVASTSKINAVVLSGEDQCIDLDDFDEDLDEHSFKPNNPDQNMKTENPQKESQTLHVGKRSADALSPLSCSPKMICIEKQPNLPTTTSTTKGQLNKNNRKITDFMKKVLPKEEMPPEICDLICDVVTDTRAMKSVTYKTVRGKVTQIDKLLMKDKNWDLNATITDGTASLEITFASQILEEMIGFTVSEFIEKKKLRRTNPEIEKYLREGFRNAEVKVQRLDALMELEFTTENEHPKVILITGLTNEQKLLIEKRIKLKAV